MAIVKAVILECDRCGYQWLPRGGINIKSLPKQCASKSCHSPYWNAGPPVKESVSIAVQSARRRERRIRKRER